MKLNDTQVRNAKPREKTYKLADGFGMTLIVNPTGAKFWRFRYRFAGNENGLSLGRYPDVSLAAAQHRDGMRKLIAAGKDPAQERQREEAELRSTFRDVGEECLGVFLYWDQDSVLRYDFYHVALNDAFSAKRRGFRPSAPTAVLNYLPASHVPPPSFVASIEHLPFNRVLPRNVDIHYFEFELLPR